MAGDLRCTHPAIMRDSQELNPYEVEVNGWNLLTGNARRFFIDNISDHCALFGEVL